MLQQQQRVIKAFNNNNKVNKKQNIVEFVVIMPEMI